MKKIEKLEKRLENMEKKLKGMGSCLEKLEDRFYGKNEHSVPERHYWVHFGITDDGPPAEELLELILDHLGLEVEEAERWKLKKK